MARQNKPATLITGHKMSKSTLQRIDLVEQQFAANNEDVANIPVEIENNEVAIQYYGYILRNMLMVDLPISNLDIPLLTETAICLSRLREINADIDKYGMYEDKYDKNGNVVGTTVRAAFKVYESLMKQYTTLSNKLGLDPSTRSSIAKAQILEETIRNDDVIDIFDD